MKKAISGRQTGKTEKLIKLSAEKQIPILVTSIAAVRQLQERAKKMELSIPEPISVSQLMSDAYLNNISEIPNIIVDDAEFVLREILSTRKVRSVEAIAICTDDPCDEMI